MAGAAGLAPLSLRVDLLPGPRTQQSVDDETVIGPEARLDHPQIVGRHLPERHEALGDLVVGADDEDIFARLLAADGRVGREQRRIRRRGRHPHAGEHAGREHAVRIVEQGADANGAGRAVDHVVDEIHAAFVLEVGLVDELERDRNAGAAAGDVAAVLGEPLVTQIGGLVEGELEMDRVGRHDGCQQCGGGDRSPRHHIAWRYAAVADAAVHRRAQFGELEIELGLAQRRLGAADGGLRIAERLRALLKGLFGDGLCRHQRLAALEIGFGIGKIGLRRRQIGARLGDRVLERPLVDGEQQIAFLDHLPVLEMHAVEIAGDARAYLHRIDGDEAADIFVEIGDGALDGRCDGHRRRRRRRGALLLALAAACAQSRKRQNHGDADRLGGCRMEAQFHGLAKMARPGRIAKPVPITSGRNDVHRLRVVTLP